MSEKIIELLAIKLDIHLKQAILKAQEFKRLADLRASSSAFNLTGTCQAVVCLNLSSNELNLPFNKEKAIKFSGLRRKMYINAVEIYRKLLGLQVLENASAKEVAKQFECCQIGDLAEDLLNRFKQADSKEKFNYPQIALASSAVFILCKKLKIKIDKRGIVEFGRVSRVIFDKLCSEMEKHSNFINESTKLKKESKVSKSFLELVQEKINDVDSLPKIKGENINCDDDESNFNYEEWKKKILEED